MGTSVDMRWPFSAGAGTQTQRPQAGGWSTWLRRALQHPGLVSAVKCTVAVLTAWLLADRVLQSPESFLAPYAALFIIGTTVRSSVSAAVRQVTVVILGVLVAALAAGTLPELAAIAGAVAVGTILGRSRWLAPDGMWVAITALLVVLYGSATNAALVFHRVLDVTVGVLVGVAVNALVLPPDQLSTARDLILQRAHELSTLLADLAHGLRSGRHDSDRGRQRVWDLHKSTGAGVALREGRESLRGNLRSPGWTKVGGSQVYLPIATVLDDTLLYVSVLEVAVEALTVADDRQAGPPASTPEQLRHEAAALLEAFSAAFDELTWDPAHHREPYLHVVQTALPEARSRLESFEESVRRHQPLPGAWPAIALAADGLWAALAVLDISDEH
ncbi:Aromatic acid exporter family member 1 [Rhodococcus koreensis]|uniref:Aromatic acid exporter family member 1 n=1 Tax=Rhodococcus koreensis TaxID=99653 RepID=A0A1H4RFW0_9NOCA|nr:Aromatic acid exporter family member 1 [Rhodococcus koreensis]